MQILSNGVRMDGTPVIRPIEEKEFAAELRDSIAGNIGQIRDSRKAIEPGVAFRGEVERKVKDPGDPRSVGWAYLINKSDPNRDEYIKLMTVFGTRRGMHDPSEPIYYNGEKSAQWFDWLNKNYFKKGLNGRHAPLYIMIIGGPEQVPFLFQSFLSTVVNVGRVSFDTLDDLKTYLEKLTRLESAPDPVVSREVTIFAPDGGVNDVTSLSRQYLARPINESILQKRGFKTTTLMAHDATKSRLQETLHAANPALVFTASHGIGEPLDVPLDEKMRINGSILCQFKGNFTDEDLFMAADVPMNIPFLEGSIFFQFACFGYGTPAKSDFAHWLHPYIPEWYAEKDFISALPKQLLKHPRGPIAYIGHVDSAFLHGFADPKDRFVSGRYHDRISPFISLIHGLLDVDPSGLSIRPINDRFNICNAILTKMYDDMRKQEFEWKPQSNEDICDNWILRSDAQNYLIFGDPAAKLRIPQN